jgi:hypothetical protein
VSTRVFGFGAVLFIAFGSLLGCSNKIEQKECDKLRADGFDLINAAQHCNVDAECVQSKWPGCARAVNAKTTGAVQPMVDKYKQGECTEPPLKCPTEIPEAYCKQGLCVHREKGMPEGAGAPAGDIIIK